MPPTRVTATGVSHVELTVRHLGRSLQFYRDQLGLRVLQEGSSEQAFPNSGKLRIYERPSRDFRFALLHYSPEPTPFGLSAAPTIILLSPIGAPPSGTSVKVDQIGITHIGLWVHGLDELYDDLRDRGVTFLEPPHTFMTLPHGTLRSAFAQDPDGIIIQLDELVSAQ